jgi:hypothetical protein
MSMLQDSIDAPQMTCTHHSSRLLARQDVLIGMTVQSLQGDSWFGGRVTNVSSEGCGLVPSIALSPGMSVRVMFPGFEGRQATVAWVADGQAGCRFATPLPAAILDYIIRMSDPAARG